MKNETATRIDAMQVTPEVTKLILTSFAGVTYDREHDLLVCPDVTVAKQVRATCQSYAIGARAAMRALVVTNAVDQDVATAMLQRLTLDEGATVPADTPPAPAPGGVAYDPAAQPEVRAARADAQTQPEVTDTEVNAPTAEATERATETVTNGLGRQVPVTGKRIRVCTKCNGECTFTYASGAKGECNPCQGKGWQTEDDIDRTKKYWEYRQARQAEAEAKAAAAKAEAERQNA
jgi:hypothetical protein